MKKPKIYVHRLGEWYPLFMTDANEALLASIGDVVSEGSRETALSSDELVERMQGCSAILSLNGVGAGEITSDVLTRVGTVELISIAAWWGQLVDAAREAGIPCTEGSNTNTIAVAEYALTAALMGIRKLHLFDRSLKGGSPWGEPRRNTGLLCESTVGLVGLGRIGWYIAHYFRALGAKVIVFDKDRQKVEALGLPLVELDDLLSSADVISLHLPVTPETRKILGVREFARIKDGAVLINSARAVLCDEVALIEALRMNRFTAYMDVFSSEPLAMDHPFRTMNNVVITPHIAGDNVVLWERCGREAILTLKDYFDGKGIRNRQYTFP